MEIEETLSKRARAWSGAFAAVAWARHATLPPPPNNGGGGSAARRAQSTAAKETSAW